MRVITVTGLVIALGACAGVEAPRVATAFTAHVVCSQTFVGGHAPDEIFAEQIEPVPVLGFFSGALGYEVDPVQQAVSARFLGGFESRAAYAAGRGCTILNGGPLPQPIARVAADFGGGAVSMPTGVMAPADPRIAVALDSLFTEPRDGPVQAVKAVVVLHDGRLVAERYAAGYGPATPMLSWSVAKSVTNALTGILVREGRLRLDERVLAHLADSPADPRAEVTVDHLLRQTSGQPFGSANDGLDPASNMLFLSPDAAATAIDAAFEPPGAWSYTDANTMIVSGVLRERIGGGASGVARFADAELFGPLGMTSAVIEFDQADTPMGAAFVFATARDWARFGQLFVDDGMVGDRRILPQGWADYSSRPTPSAGLGYGAGFWTNRGDSAGATARRGWGAAAGSFFANGNFGQTIYIDPEARLVIVRLGYAQGDARVSTQRVSAFARAVTDALARPQSATLPSWPTAPATPPSVD